MKRMYVCTMYYYPSYIILMSHTVSETAVNVVALGQMQCLVIC